MLNKFKPYHYTAKSGITVGYRLYVPSNYSKDKKYPFILFMHGAGERGDDNELQLRLGMVNAFKDACSPIYDCIVLAPQCPKEHKWVNVEKWSDCIYSTDEIPESEYMKIAVELTNRIANEYAVDHDRMYVTGLSMGGYATWDIIVRHPDMFAAAIPICGGCDVENAERLVNMPIKTFHGALDEVVPIQGTQAMIKKLCVLGNKNAAMLTYPDRAHGIWGYVYEIDGIFDWLLSNKKSDRY